MRMSSTLQEICDEVTGRLVSGDKAGNDPMLAQHLGSCLRCFRTAADLRELPRLESLLQEGLSQAEWQRDPGEAFWRDFPNRVAAAWQPEPARARPAVKAKRRGLRDWLRLPFSAALAGAALAGALVFVLVRHPDSKNPAMPVAALQPGEAESTVPVGVASSQEEDAEMPNGETLEGLEEAELDVLLAEMRVEAQPALVAGGVATGFEIEDVSEPVVSATEEVEALETEELMALAAELRRSSRI